MWIVWPFKKKNFGSAWNVCSDFRRFVDASMGRFLIQDEDLLPHPKSVVFESICILLMTETNQTILDSVKSCAFELAFFQKDVGPSPLHPLGTDLDRIEPETYAESGLSTYGPTDPSGKEKYDRYKLLRDADWARMQATMKKILDEDVSAARTQ